MKTKRYITARRRIAWFLFASFIISQFTPQALVMAAPQMFASPTAGVSRTPLGVAHFDTPGFGDLEDAVNLATGNVYAALDGVSRNNLTNAGDETANSIGGKWQVTQRMRLVGFSQPSAPTGPSGYTYCSNENQHCVFSGTKQLAYGVNGSFSYRTLTDSTVCSNDVFGDPAQGTVKACFMKDATTPPVVGPAGYVYCSGEGNACNFTGTKNIAYGANGQYYYGDYTDSVACGNQTFTDPVPNTVKACFVGNLPLEEGYTMLTGDGSASRFRKTQPSNLAWFNDMPSWISRYKGASNASPLISGVALYKLVSTPGKQYAGEWLVRVAVGQGFAIHHYAQDGTRATFYGDGEYADFGQNLSQQFRSAQAGDPEGVAATSPKTELTYTAANSGRISKVKDEWGRVSTYVWNSDGTLQSIFHLLRNENDNNSYTRLTQFAYTTINNERVITYMVYMTYDGIGNSTTNLIGRWFGFEYKVENGRVLLAKVSRPTLSKLGYVDDGSGGKGWRTTTYQYDSSGRVTQVLETGKPSIQYSYGTSSDFKGPMVTVIQCSALLTVTCTTDNNRKQSEYHFDPFGRLRKQRVRDFNPFVADNISWYKNYGDAEKFRETTYSYYKNGNTALITEPSGKTTHFIYDSRNNLIRTAVYASNPFNPEYIVPVVVSLSGNYKQLKNQTASFTAKVRDVANAGVKWQIKQGSSVLWDSDSAPSGNGYASSPTFVSGADVNDPSFKTYTLSFMAAGSTYTNANTQYTLVATSKTDSRQYSDVNFIVTPKISRVGFDGTIPPRMVVVPGCVEASSATCSPGVSRTSIWIPGSVTATPGFTPSNYGISGSVTAVAAASSGATTVPTPAQFIVSTGTNGITVQPPAWSTSLQAQAYFVTVRAASVEDPTVTTDFTLTVGYMGVVAAPMMSDIRYPGGEHAWGSYLSTSQYQHWVSVVNPPTTPLSITWAATGAGSIANNTGCLYTGDMAFWDGPKQINLTATVTQYPQVVLNYSDVEFFTAWDNYHGCTTATSTANGRKGDVYGGTSLTPSLSGATVRTLSLQTGTNTTTASGSQVVNNDGQTFQTDTTDEPEFPSDVRPGYVRDNTVSYNSDNLPLEQTQPANTGANFSYGAVKQVHSYTYNTATSGGQSFQTAVTHRVGTVVAGAEQRYTLETYDVKGRLTQVDRVGAGNTRTQSLGYGFNGTQIWTVYEPNPIGSSSAGVRSASNEPQAVEYGDLPSSSTTNGIATGYYYDMLGNAVWESCFNCYTKQVTRAADGSLTPTDFHRATFRAYNGFGQQVWQAVYSWDGTTGGNDKWESYTVNHYYSSGELDVSITNSPKNLTVYNYNTIPGSDDFGRLISIKKGPDANTDATLDTERQVTTMAYDKFGRVASSNANSQNVNYTYDTQDRFARSMSDAPESRFVYRTYSPSGTPDYDCTGSLAVNTLTHCQGKTVDSLGRVTRIDHAFNEAINDSGAWGWSETIQYDAFDRPVRSTDDRLEMNDSTDDRTTKMRYDDEGHLLMLVGPKLRTKAGNGYIDGRRSAVAYTYDALGLKTKEAVALNGNYDINSSLPDSDAAVTTYAYGNWDRVISSVDPRGYTTTLRYDGLGNQIEQKRQIGSGSYAITQTAYDALGHATTRIDPRGKVWKTAYNELGLKARETDARGIAIKIYGYSADGLLERIYEPREQAGYSNASVAAGLNPDTLEGYNMTKRYNYGASPYPLSECSPYLTNDASSDVNCTAKTTDAIGRVTKDTLSDGGVITRAYDTDGNVTSLTDADGFKTTYRFDAMKRIRTTTQEARAAGAGATIDTDAGLGAGLTSTYAYDLMGNLTRKVERGLTTRYEYNSLGKVIAETRAHNSNVTGPLYKKYTYRLDGGRTAETNYSYQGDLSSYASSQPRIATSAGSPSVTDGNLQVFELDAVGNVTAESSKGKASDGTMLLEKVVSYTYNGLNQRATREFNGHEAIYQAQRNPDGKFRLVNNNGNSVNPMGAMDTRVYTNWQYDVAGNLVYKADSLASDFSNPFNTFSYNYTDTGKVQGASRDVSVKIPAFQNDVNLGSTVTLAATNGYSQSVYNSRDQVWQVNVEDNSADGGNTVGQKFSRINQYSFYVDGSRSDATVLLWDGGGVGTGVKGNQHFTYDKRGREITRTDSDGAPDTRKRSSSIAGIIGAGTGTATTPGVGDVLKTLMDQQLANPNTPGLQPARPVKGTATISTTYGAGTKSMTIVDGNGKCLYQQDTVLTIGGQVRSSKEWEWEPRNPSSQSDYVDVACGLGQPSRQRIIAYNAIGAVSQQNLSFSDVGTHNDNFQIVSTAAQTVAIVNNNFGQPQTETTTVTTGATGTEKVAVNRCEPGPWLAVNSTDVEVTENYEKCGGLTGTVTVPPHSSVPVMDHATAVFDHYEWKPYSQSQTKSTVVTHNYDPSLNGFETGKAQVTTITGTDNGNFQTVPDDSDGNYTFITDSRGDRLKVFGGKYSGYIKRYDADGQTAMFFHWEGIANQPYAVYNDFRYDPKGNEVLSSTGGLIQGISGASGYTVKRDSNATYFADGDVQLIRKRLGDLTQTTNTYASSNLVRDAMYSSADGINDTTQWSGVVLFSAVPVQGGLPLDAPTTPLSATTRVEPTDVNAPNQGVPNTNPGQVTAPNTTTAQSHSTDTTTGTAAEQQTFGVHLLTLATPASASNATNGAFSSDTALTSPTSQQPTSTVFQVQAGNLEPPSTVLPAALTGLNALDVAAPLSVLPSTPSTGLSDPSAILPPSSATLPSVGNTPADDPGTVQAPNSVTNNLPPSVTNQPTGTIKPPESAGGTVRSLDVLTWIQMSSQWYANQFQDFINASDANRKMAQERIEAAIHMGGANEAKRAQELGRIIREFAFIQYATSRKLDEKDINDIVNDLRTIPNAAYANNIYDNLIFLLTENQDWRNVQVDILKDAVGDIDSFTKLSSTQQKWWIEHGWYGEEKKNAHDFMVGFVSLDETQKITDKLYLIALDWQQHDYEHDYRFDRWAFWENLVNQLGAAAPFILVGLVAIGLTMELVAPGVFAAVAIAVGALLTQFGLEGSIGGMALNIAINTVIGAVAAAITQFTLNGGHLSEKDIGAIIAGGLLNGLTGGKFAISEGAANRIAQGLAKVFPNAAGKAASMAGGSFEKLAEGIAVTLRSLLNAGAGTPFALKAAKELCRTMDLRTCKNGL